MPTTRVGTNTTGGLRSVDKEGKIIIVREEEALKCQPSLIVHYNHVTSEVKKLELEIRRMLRSVADTDEPDADKAKELIISMRKKDDQKLAMLQFLATLKTVIQVNTTLKSANKKEAKRKKEQSEVEKKRREAEDEKCKKDKDASRIAEKEEWFRMYEQCLRKLENVKYERGWTDEGSISGESKSGNTTKNNRSESPYDSHYDEDSDASQRVRGRRVKIDVSKEGTLKSHLKEKERRTSHKSKTRRSREEYAKIPALLPEYNSEDKDPEQFVADFNDILDCLEEEPSVRVTFWFKNRVKMPGSTWDAGLDPKKHTLSRYQKEFLSYFWSPTMQRLAIENFERAPLKLDSDISVSCQILTWFARIKKVKVDPSWKTNSRAKSSKNCLVIYVGYSSVTTIVLSWNLPQKSQKY